MFNKCRERLLVGWEPSHRRSRTKVFDSFGSNVPESAANVKVVIMNDNHFTVTCALIPTEANAAPSVHCARAYVCPPSGLLWQRQGGLFCVAILGWGELCRNLSGVKNSR